MDIPKSLRHRLSAGSFLIQLISRRNVARDPDLGSMGNRCAPGFVSRIHAWIVLLPLLRSGRH